MEESSDRKELKRRLAQAKRMSVSTSDAVTAERLTKLVADLEEQLRCQTLIGPARVNPSNMEWHPASVPGHGPNSAPLLRRALDQPRSVKLWRRTGLRGRLEEPVSLPMRLTICKSSRDLSHGRCGRDRAWKVMP